MKNLILLFICFVLLACGENMSETRYVTADEEIEYYQHEPHYEPKMVKGGLLTLVYDIPYFGACGVFPPLHVANQTFVSGGGDGGMGPGASWKPFQLSETDYKNLIDLVRNTDPKTLQKISRFFHIKFIEDNSFDSIQDQFEWQDAVCNKHRERYREENAKLQ